MRIADEESTGIICLSVFDVVSKVCCARRDFRRQRTPQAVDEICRVDGIAVRPARVLAQMEDEFGGVVVDFPALSDCGNRIQRFGVVFHKSFVEGHVDAGLGLTRADRRIERLWFAAIYITKDVVFGRSCLAEKLFVAS